MDNDALLSIIKKQFPQVSKDRIHFLDDGWDHYVYVIDDKTAFRFPRTKEHGQKDKVETKFFESFASKSPVRVQNMKLFTDAETGIRYQMYDFIPGERFTRDLAKTLSFKELSDIAKSLGQFLTVLHSYSIDTAKQLGMEGIVSPLDYVDYWEDFLKKEIEPNMFHYFSEDEKEWIKNVFNEYITAVRKHPFEVKVTHFDLLPEHILIDPVSHTLSGIIDFSLRISDPAYDFSYFDRYGKGFLNTVITHYPLAVGDETFPIRRRFYAARLGFSFLSQAMERDKEKVSTIVEQIHGYIAEH